MPRIPAADPIHAHDSRAQCSVRCNRTDFGARTGRTGDPIATQMAAAAALLLGEDGRGYELARRLEACGAWREWLGDDSAHAALAQHLTSPATWDAFLYPAASPSPPPRPLLLLQLRVRALLFDKASAALLLPPRGAAPVSLHSINANCECSQHTRPVVPPFRYRC